MLLNLEHCLAGVNYANSVIERARARRAIAVPFAAERAAAATRARAADGGAAPAREARAGLLALWSALLPGRAPPHSERAAAEDEPGMVRVSVEVEVDEDAADAGGAWGEVGFQGADPATDFRSMGLLALDQLVAFSRGRAGDARAALATASHPVRYFPFATFGVNLTGFVVQLLDARLLDHRLYIAHDARGLLAAASEARVGSPVASPVAGGAPPLPPPGMTPPSASGARRGDIAAAAAAAEHPAADDADALAAGMDELDRLYGELFVRFAAFWVEAQPANTMAFPGVWDAFRERVTSEMRRAAAAAEQ